MRPAPKWQRWWRRAVTAATVLLVAAVAVLTTPPALGGNTGYTIVAGRSMQPTIDSGDLVITRTKPTYGQGDVVVYRIPAGEPGAGVKVIHRITGGSAEDGFVTTGDNRNRADVWRPTHDDIIGAHWRTVPAGGQVFLWLRSPLALGIVLCVVAFRWALRHLLVESGAAGGDVGDAPQLPLPPRVDVGDPRDRSERDHGVESMLRPLLVPAHPGGAELVRPFTLDRRAGAHLGCAVPVRGDLDRTGQCEDDVRSRRASPAVAMAPDERRAITEVLTAILAMPTHPARRRDPCYAHPRAHLDVGDLRAGRPDRAEDGMADHR